MFELKPPRRQRLFPLLIAAVLGAQALDRAAAHDVPEEIVIHAFVKPEGERLRLLVRLPLILLMNLDLPKEGPGYLDLTRMEEPLKTAAAAAAEQIVLFEDDRPLVLQQASGRISLPSDQSFSSYREALAHVQGASLPPHARVFWNQGFFDAHLEYAITTDRSAFSIQVWASGLGAPVTTFVRFIPAEGPARAYELSGETGRVALDPRWHQAAWTFVQSGLRRIVQGADPLLFLFCLVIPLRSLRRLIFVATSFTLAHSLTLIAAASGLAPSGAWFPPLVETLIAASILYMALENIVWPGTSYRWVTAFLFGLVHGFGFSFALQESLQFAGSHLLLSLLSFNLGVELGQVLVIAVMVPTLSFFFRHLPGERTGAVVLSVIAAHTAWHWLAQRAGELARHRLPLPNTPTLVLLIAVPALLLLAGGLMWFLARRGELFRFLKRVVQ